jgi:hypothetical protein
MANTFNNLDFALPGEVEDSGKELDPSEIGTLESTVRQATLAAATSKMR